MYVCMYVLYVLYGQAHRQINKDDLVNWGVKERMMVKMMWTEMI